MAILDPDEIKDPDTMQASSVVDPDDIKIVDPDKKGKWSTQTPLPEPGLAQPPIMRTGMVGAPEPTLEAPKPRAATIQAPPPARGLPSGTMGGIEQGHPVYENVRRVLQRAGVTPQGRVGLNPVGTALAPLTMLPAAAGVAGNALTGEQNRVLPGVTGGDVMEQLAYLIPMLRAGKLAQAGKAAITRADIARFLEEGQKNAETRPIAELLKEKLPGAIGESKPMVGEKPRLAVAFKVGPKVMEDQPLKGVEPNQIISGKVGETHGDLFDRLSDEKKNLGVNFDDGFVDLNTGKFYNRKEAADLAKQHDILRPKFLRYANGKTVQIANEPKLLDANDLPQAQDSLVKNVQDFSRLPEYAARPEAMTDNLSFEQWLAKQGKSQAGGVNPEVLVPPEAVQAVENVGKVAGDIKAAFAPASVGEAGRITAESLRENLGTRVQASNRAEKALDPAHAALNKMSTELNYALYDAIETGNMAALNDRMRPIAQAFRDVLDPRQAELVKRGILQEFNENYLPHIYDFSFGTRVRNMLQNVTGRPIKGASPFLKPRTYGTLKEAMANGYKPVSTNAADLVFMRAQQIDKFLAGLDTKDELVDRGIMKAFKVGSKDIPDGWAKVVDPIGRWQYRNAAKELVTAGDYWMPADGARIIERYLSPGLRGSATFRAYRGFNNLLNNFQLGFSAFHLGFTSMDTMVSKFALALDHAAHGEFGKAILEGNPLSILTAPGMTAAKGHMLMEAWYDPKIGDPMMRRIVDAIRMGGGRVKMDNIYRTQVTEKMMQAFRSGNPLSWVFGGLGRAPFALVEQSSRPMMEWLVPRQKLGVAFDLLRAELERNPEISNDALRTLATKVWNSVDNRMGQLVYDNLFWNNALKDLGFASVRSLGWNIGTIREILGGGVDTVKQVKTLLQGGKPELTYRMGYVLSLPMVVGMAGALTQYLATGKGPGSVIDDPRNLKDYFFPKSGKIDEHGREERWSYPSYMRDIGAFANHPVSTIGHKAAPALNLISEMLMNEDFFGGKIFNEHDPLVKEVSDIAKYALGRFTPMGVQQAQTEMRRGQQFPVSALPFVGITPAPAYITESHMSSLVRGLKEAKKDFHNKLRHAKDDAERKTITDNFKFSIDNLNKQIQEEAKKNYANKNR